VKHIKRIFFILSITIHIHAQTSKKAIIIGASSGMGREVAKLLSAEGYILGLAARRLPLLHSLQEEIGQPCYIKQIDVASPTARDDVADLIGAMGGVDLFIISISAYLDNRSASWTKKERTLNVDARGFIAVADVAFSFFEQQGHGHFVGISSTSGLRGSPWTPVYSAAKACISYYMEAMRNAMQQRNIPVIVTDVVPGWVAVEHSPLGWDESAYWEITVAQAGKEIVEGIKRADKIVYVPSRVKWVALLLKYLPDWIYNKYLNWL
jgi:short-subunit dehydrogenase